MLAPLLRILAGLIIVVLGIYVWLGQGVLNKICPAGIRKIAGISSLFLLGFIVGVSPCPPLLGLLVELAIISKNALDALGYALFFGLGTFISGLLAIGVLSGIFRWAPEKLFNSEKSNFIFRTICALLLIIMGLNLILMFFKFDF